MFFKIYAAALLVAAPYFLWARNWEFLLYMAGISLFVWFLWRTNRVFHYKKTSLVLLFIWLALHIVGGVIPIGDGRVLYHWIIVPLVPEPYSILKFDQLMHFLCYVAIGFLADDAIAPLLKPGLPRVARFLTVALVAIGVGALNEVMEFVAVFSFPGTGVGDYTNNAIDLVCNAVGALSAATMRLRRPT